jgi:[ribosomal protein S5]-alanine N-acetyltransferase
MLPTLKTGRLLLRPATASDVDGLWTLWTDPEVRRSLWGGRVIAREQAAATLAECSELSEQGLGLWMLMPRDAGIPPRQVLGCAALLPVSTAADLRAAADRPGRAARRAGSRHVGTRYAVEALDALLGHASDGLGLSRMAAVTDIPNARSDRMLQRAGLVVLSEVEGPKYPLRTYLCDLTSRANASAPTVAS